jgi:hypothetical protein
MILAHREWRMANRASPPSRIAPCPSPSRMAGRASCIAHRPSRIAASCIVHGHRASRIARRPSPVAHCDHLPHGDGEVKICHICGSHEVQLLPISTRMSPYSL